MVTAFDAAVARAATDLNELGARWALIGGLAVSARSAPRFTKDVDVVVAVVDDAASEASVDILPGLVAPVATTGHLIALKILARRGQDLTDLDALLDAADETDIAQARAAVALIVARGFDRAQDLVADLEQVLAASKET